MTLIVGLGLGSSAAVSTISAQSGTTRDSRVKEAIAAADAGLQHAVYRENKILTTATLPCVVNGLAQQLMAGAPSSDLWCPPVTESVGDNSFTYRVKPWIPMTVGSFEGRQIVIVSTGVSGGVKRRVAEVAFAPLGSQAFGLEGAIGVDGVTMNGNTRIDANAGTNGSFSFSGPSPIVCGDMRHGPGGAVPGGHQCSGYQVTEGKIDLPPPTTQNVQRNDVGRFFAPQQLPGDTRVGNVTWDATTRELSLTGTGVMTMGGEDYVICKLQMSGSSTLIMAAGSKVRIFFDTPERCNYGDGVSQINISGSSKILSTSYNPGAGVFDLPGLYVLGSSSLSTKVAMTGNGAEGGEFVLYAPRSDVTLSGNAVAGYTTFTGAVAGKTLTLNGRARIAKEMAAPSPEVPTALLYTRQRYVECTGGVGVPSPDSNC